MHQKHASLCNGPEFVFKYGYSSQYHVVNDWFTTFTSTTPPQPMIDQWANMFPSGLISIPTDSEDDVLSEDWLLENELAVHQTLRM